MVTIRQQRIFGLTAASVWTVFILIMSFKEIGRWMDYQYLPSFDIYMMLGAYGIAAFLWTTHYGVVIHMKKRYIKRYLNVFGLKLGFKEPLREIEKIFINRQLIRQYMNYTFDRDSYQYWAFLKLADGEKIKIKSQVNKGVLIKRLRQYNRILKTVIIDTTTDPPEVVDS